MAYLEITRPNKGEWTTCLMAKPDECRGIAYLCKKLEEIETNKGSDREKLDGVKKGADDIAGRCPAFNYFHRKHGRNSKLEELPCQILRRHIFVDRLGGRWTEHDYTVPAGKLKRKGVK